MVLKVKESCTDSFEQFGYVEAASEADASKCTENGFGQDSKVVLEDRRCLSE